MPASSAKNFQSVVAIQWSIGDHNQSKLFLEVGPHSILSGPVCQSLAKADTKDHRYRPTIAKSH